MMVVSIRNLCLAALAGGVLAVGHAQPHEGKVPPGQAKKQERQEAAERGARPAREPQAAHADPRPGAVFTDAHRNYARSYYTQQYARNCPPGLAKKNNGCLPPGQAKKLTVGEPLPTGVILYPVPQPVIVQLPPVPIGYRYVRIGEDIVLLSPRTQVVVDVIQGILRP